MLIDCSVEYEENCLFIAKYSSLHQVLMFSLPHPMSNGDIANKLLAVFQEYGDILSVKASRDSKDRPFGFVEFKDIDSAIKAKENVSELMMGNRRVRVEFAKQQMKLGIRKECPSDTLEINFELFQEEILHFVTSKDVVFSISYDSPSTSTLSAIVKFENISKASTTFDEWSKKEDWEVVWLNSNNSNRSNQIRNSGLVQLVPSKKNEEEKSEVAEERMSYGKNYNFKHCEELKINKEIEINSSLDSNILFVGRLNGRLITIEYLVEYFSEWGKIIEVKLYNRNVIGSDGVVLDAYSLILFEETISKCNAIASGDGNVWLGQSIRCDDGKKGAIFNFI